MQRQEVEVVVGRFVRCEHCQGTTMCTRGPKTFFAGKETSCPQCIEKAGWGGVGDIVVCCAVCGARGFLSPLGAVPRMPV